MMLAERKVSLPSAGRQYLRLFRSSAHVEARECAIILAGLTRSGRREGSRERQDL